MENVVPNALQRLRAADILRMAGLAAASLGQEYYRSGIVQSTQRQGTLLSGVVDVPHAATNVTIPATEDVVQVPSAEKSHHRYSIEVGITSPTVWTNTCSCDTNTPLLCSHAAALLYQWLAHPGTFVSTISPGAANHLVSDTPATKPIRTLVGAKPVVVPRGPSPLESLMDLLAQPGLSELRAMAREYEIATNGMNKQQLAQALLAALKMPDVVRHVAATLEKPQRQLLAALTLAGGSMTDDDLRGLFERFSLGQPNQLQNILIALQSKSLLFRTSLNSSSQQRPGLGGALLDLGWYVPVEIRVALRVMVPITPFDPQQISENNDQPTIQQTEPYSLLADLLLVARALDGYQLTPEDEWLERSMIATRSSESGSFSRASGLLSTDGSVPIPPPGDMPSASLLATLQAVIPRSPTFLRFAVRLLHLADILHKDDSGSPYLRVLPNTAQLLLGPTHADVARDLFELWLTQSSYEELFDLQEDGLHLRCRATSLNLPILRPGELDAENSEARQSLVALLALAPLKQWISFPAFARFVYRLNPSFLQKRQRLFSSPHWWLELGEGRPLRPLQLTDWLQAEIHYLTRFLIGPLHWWGVCDLALSPQGGLLAFRLTPLAGWLLSGLVLEKETTEHHYHVLANSLEIVETGEILVTSSSHTWPVIELMETFTEAANVRHGRLCYRLTPKALGDALSRGCRPTKLLELLRSLVASDTQQESSLPQTVTQLERWIANYGRARIYTGVTLLETADTMVMRELSATTSLDGQVVQPVHPTLLILKKQGIERIIDDLKRRGQSPLLHEEELYGTE